MIGFGAGLPGWAFLGAGVASSTPAVGSTALTPAAVPAPPPPPHPLSATSISRAGPTGLLGTRPSFSTDRLDEGLHDELRLEHGSGGVAQGASGGGRAAAACAAISDTSVGTMIRRSPATSARNSPISS